MNLTKDEAVRLFREHWKYLAETGGGKKEKRQWLKDKGYCVILSCFLCEYTYQNCNSCCSKCPVEWTHGHCMTSCYCDWTFSKSPEERKRLAKIISELPEKEVTPWDD